MAQPAPNSVDLTEVANLAHATIKGARFPQPAVTKIFANIVSHSQEWALTYHDVPLS